VQTIDAVIRQRCLTHADRPAMRQKEGGGWREYSYGQFWSLSDRVAAGLLKCGIRPGDHVALYAPSSVRWVVAYFGILKAGGVVIPVDKELKRAELRHVLDDSDARMIFTDPGHVETVLEIVDQLPLLQRVILLHPTEPAVDREMSTRFDEFLSEWRSIVDSCSIPPERVERMDGLAQRVRSLISALRDRTGGAPPVREPLSFDELLFDAPLPDHGRRGDDIAAILYTSGTTGRSKGAMLSHANIISNIKGATIHFSLDDSIHTLSFLPINHVFEQVCGIILPLSLGGKISFCESLKKLGENLLEVRPTFFLAVPAVYRMLYDRIMKSIDSRPLSRMLFGFPLTRRIVASSVRKKFVNDTIFISGGAALDPAVAEGLGRLGIMIYQGYGITETSPVIAAESPSRRKIGTVGYPIAGVEVRIDDPNDEGVGEIVVHGPNVMKGYYKNPQATSEVLVEGWYHTGDLGRVDSDGMLTICGRVKNLIVTPNGKNVYPEEVENELLNSPFIAEVMVYGHKVSPTAEEVHALIYPNQEALDTHARDKGIAPLSMEDIEGIIRKEVLRLCANLADYKRVKKFTLRDEEFPKTTTRKIKRFEVEATVSLS